MSKTLTLKGLALAFLLALGWQGAFAQTFWTETFSDQASSTTNWVTGGTNDGPNSWEWTNVVNAGAWQPGNFGAPTASSGYMWFDSDVNGDFAHDITLTGTGNPANCTGKSDVHLKFYTLFRIFSAIYNGQVGVSTDGVNFTYYTVPEFQGLNGASAATDRFEGWVDLDVSGQVDGAAQVWVQFRWAGQYEYYWKVDDIELYEYTTPTSAVTFQVNMALQTVDPGGVRIAGSFNNWSDEAMTDMGNGLWSITKTLTNGEQALYKFKNGPNGWEAGQAACGVSDGFGGYNRTYTASGDATLPAVCFNQCGPCVVPCNLNPNAIICDNFDTYVTTLKLGPQAPHWSTWDGVEGTTEDGIVTTEQANSAPNSVKIVSTAATGGPQDVVLNLGNKTSGRYELKWKFYVPAGKQGYYNIQDVVPIGAGAWNLDVFFEAAGSGHIQIGSGASLATFTYPYGQWFEVKHVIDLDNNLLSLYINGVFVKKMAYPNNLGGIDFYGTNNLSQFYFDDLEYVSLPAVVYNVDNCDGAIDLTTYFGQAPGVAQTTGLFDNTTATTVATDPVLDCWGETSGNDFMDNTMWYTFTGDGNRYHIETVPCNATNYIGLAQDDPGDTQMAIFSGNDCAGLTLEACADDLYPTGDPDWRAGLDFETTNGTNYFILIDGFNIQGVAATGEYCIEVTQTPSVDCASGAVGEYAVANNGIVCNLGNWADLITIDDASFTIPTIGPVYGLTWAITTEAIPAGIWPPDATGYWGSFGISPTLYIPSLANDNAPLTYGTWYLTPVVVGGGVDTDLSNTGAFLHETDIANGCYFVGTSVPFSLLPPLNDIVGVGSSTNEIVPPGNNGTISLAVDGGIAEVVGDPSLYFFTWSNGAATQNLTGLTAGTYTVTITDPTGCVAPFTLSVTVGLTVGTTDPSSVKMLTVSPNPTNNDAVLNLSLESAKDVRIELVNTLGQTVQSINAGTVQTLSQKLQLAGMPEGAYFLRVTIDNETAVRRLVIQR